MPRPVSPQRAPDGADEHELLNTLLSSEVPSRRGQIRPAKLRSTAQQRAEALHGFKFRTWLDHSLAVAERALVLAAVAAFLYWLADGYGRDWLYAMAAAQAAPPVTPVATPALSVPSSAAQPGALGASLPFTRPEDEQAENAENPEAGLEAEHALEAEPSASAPRDAFMDPQSMRSAVDHADPRPQRLSIPAISATMRVDEVFLLNGQWQVAEYAAGYHNGTALPGLIGNSVISGHAGLRGAVFKDLGRLKPGDEIIVETASWRYTYRVRSSLSVWPHQVEVMNPTPTPVLTLITCTNWDLQRLIVFADLADARPL
jgi:sortase A